MKHFLAGAFVELVKLLAAAHAAAIARSGRGRAERMAREAMNEAGAVERELLRARLGRLDSANRPRYLPPERLQILLHKARYGVSLKELARRFVLSVETIKEWIVEADGGVEARVKTASAVNRLADAVKEIAVLLRWQQLRWGANEAGAVKAKNSAQCSAAAVPATCALILPVARSAGYIL
jgi:hypothetical protein